MYLKTIHRSVVTEDIQISSGVKIGLFGQVEKGLAEHATPIFTAEIYFGITKKSCFPELPCAHDYTCYLYSNFFFILKNI